MSVKSKFYNIDKRIKSTKRPSNDDTPITYDIVFKQPTNILEPDIILDTAGLYPDFTYCIIEIPLPAAGEDVTKDFYYFVKSTTIVNNNIFELHLKLDSLATVKEQILSTTAYVQYSSSDYNQKIIDGRIPRLTDNTWSHEEYTSIFVDDESDFQNEYVFFITVGGEYSSSAYEGGYNYYVFTETGWNDFCALLCDAQWEVDIKKFFASVDSGLISCRRMPVKYESLPLEAVSSIRIGRVDIPYPAFKLSQRYIHRTINAEIPNYKTDFNQWAPYVRLKMYIPFIGTIDLPTDQFKDDDVLIDYVLDLTSGQMDVHICHSNLNNRVITLTTEVGGQLPTSVNNVNLAKVAAHGASAVGLLAAKNVVGALEQAAEAVSTGLSDNIGNKGSFGGGRSEVLQSQFIIYAIYWQPVFNANNADFIAYCGRPCYKVISLAQLTGYIQTINFQLGGHWFKEIKDEVNALLDSGIYIE